MEISLFSIHREGGSWIQVEERWYSEVLVTFTAGVVSGGQGLWIGWSSWQDGGSWTPGSSESSSIKEANGRVDAELVSEVSKERSMVEARVVCLSISGLFVAGFPQTLTGELALGLTLSSRDCSTASIWSSVTSSSTAICSEGGLMGGLVVGLKRRVSGGGSINTSIGVNNCLCTLIQLDRC